MAVWVDLAGRKINRLEFIRWLRGPMWECRCECGAVCTVNASNVRSGHTKSCGCLKIEKQLTHQMTHSPEYAVWANITGRCLNPNHPSWPDYGGRGITLHPEWVGRGGFTAFFAHMGPRPSVRHQVDRIDNARSYEPGNVQWATRLQNMRNTRGNRWIEIDGARKLLHEWAAENDIHETTVIHRINRGMSERDAIFTPARFGGRRASRKR